MKRIPGLIFAFLCTFYLLMGADAEQETNTSESKPFSFSEAQKENRFFKDFERWAKQDAGGMPSADALLCIGSSSMRKWGTVKEDLAPLGVTHRGFGGSTMADVLVFKEFFARYQAGSILVYEGDNDLDKGTTPEEFIQRCRTFVDFIQARKADTVFYFLAAKPSPKRWAKWEIWVKSNNLLKAYCENESTLHFIDIATPMLDDEGEVRKDLFVKDRLHMNAEGYAIWTRVIRKALKLKPKPKSKSDGKSSK